jgi:hypothetical protein
VLEEGSAGNKLQLHNTMRGKNKERIVILVFLHALV